MDTKTGSLDQFNLFEKCILYDMGHKKNLDFDQLFFDQLVECINGNKSPTYVSYPQWLALLRARAGLSYNINHGECIPFPVLS